jgi:Lar family restriction alleviation protein
MQIKTEPVEPLLLPCPFCGSPAFDSFDGDIDHENEWSANCLNEKTCGATIEGMIGREAAVQAWNRRARTP